VITIRQSQGSQINTDYTEKQIKPQITRKESNLWRFAQVILLFLREAPKLPFRAICGLICFSV
jgi:hypothetical protein